MAQLTLLLDDGGVLNDNSVRGGQWPALVGEFFAPRLGGDPAAWAEANRVVLARLLAPAGWAGLFDAARDHADYERQYYQRWLNGMCAFVGLPPVPEAECVALGWAAEADIVPRIRSAFPGAVEALRTLRGRGYKLHTASGGGSRLLALYLEGMEVRDCFERLYGPDLIDALKNGPAFYECLLADLGLPPDQALFVDDSSQALGWAAQSGARTLRVGAEAAAKAGPHIGSLAELPAYLQSLGQP